MRALRYPLSKFRESEKMVALLRKNVFVTILFPTRRSPAGCHSITSLPAGTEIYEYRLSVADHDVLWTDIIM